MKVFLIIFSCYILLNFIVLLLTSAAWKDVFSKDKYTKLERCLVILSCLFILIPMIVVEFIKDKNKGEV